MDPTSTFGKDDGLEKKCNHYKKIRLRVTLCGGKWKKRKIQRWRSSEPADEKKEKNNMENKGFGFAKLKQRGRKYRE